MARSSASLGDHRKIAPAVDALRAVIKQLNRQGVTYERMAHETGLSSSAIRQFTLRKPASPRINNTARTLLEYVSQNMGELRRISDQLVGIVAQIHSALESENSLAIAGEKSANAIAYQQAMKVFHISEDHARRTGRKISGYYICYRNSIISDRIVKTSLHIYQHQETKAWEFEHIYSDKLDERRITRGILLPMSTSIYMIGNIEIGAGIEVIVLGEPVSYEYKRMHGFILTMSFSREPVLSRVICVRTNEENFINETLGAFESSDASFGDELPLVLRVLNNLPERKALTLLIL